MRPASALHFPDVNLLVYLGGEAEAQFLENGGLAGWQTQRRVKTYFYLEFSLPAAARGGSILAAQTGAAGGWRAWAPTQAAYAIFPAGAGPVIKVHG